METNAAPGKGWHITLWFAQVLLAIGFLAGGWGKMVWPMEQIHAQVPWAPAVPEYLMRFIGVSEVLGAIGLILPALTRIRPGLTVLSAGGLALIMALAAGFHLFRTEYVFILFNLAYFALAIFIVWGRMVKHPIQPR
jgi:putative oxidoreductase